MKKNLFLFLVLLMAVSGLQAQSVYTIVNSFKGERITGIEASGVWNIKLSQGDATRVELSFPERFEKQLILTLRHGELKIGFRGNVKTKIGEKFEAIVVCSALHGIELSGACTVEGNGSFDGENVKFDLSGASVVNLSGRLEVDGGVYADLSGASKISLREVVAPQFNIEQSGASSLQFSGEIEMGRIEISGASKFDMNQLEVRKVEVELSGASHGRLNVSEMITGELSGVSKLYYSGTASTRVDVSGSATLRHQ